MLRKYNPTSHHDVLVVGSAHIDTVCDCSFNNNIIDNMGTITHSVGGSAYNIATNLAINNSDSELWPALYTLLPKQSWLTTIIKYKLKSSGVYTRFIHITQVFAGKPVVMGGFVGLRDMASRDITAAATETPVNDHNLVCDKRGATKLKKALTKSKVVVLDTNLSKDTIEQVFDFCCNQRTPCPIIISLVSQPKASRYSALDVRSAGSLCVCIAGRTRDFEHLFQSIGWEPDKIESFKGLLSGPDQNGSLNASECCAAAKSEALLCTSLDRYALIVGKQNSVYYFKPLDAIKNGNVPENMTGVTDAITSSFVEFFFKKFKNNKKNGESFGDQFDAIFSEDNFKELQRRMNIYAYSVINQKGATRNSELTYSSEEIETSLQMLVRLAREFREPLFIAAMTLIALAAAYASK